MPPRSETLDRVEVLKHLTAEQLIAIEQFCTAFGLEDDQWPEIVALNQVVAMLAVANYARNTMLARPEMKERKAFEHAAKMLHLDFETVATRWRSWKCQAGCLSPKLDRAA